jgi:hypothetical protein
VRKLTLRPGCPQSYTLMSTDYAHPTRLECKRLLEDMGVAVMVQNADGMAILKCRANERRGASRAYPFLPWETAWRH